MRAEKDTTLAPHTSMPGSLPTRPRTETARRGSARCQVAFVLGVAWTWPPTASASPAQCLGEWCLRGGFRWICPKPWIQKSFNSVLHLQMWEC